VPLGQTARPRRHLCVQAATRALPEGPGARARLQLHPRTNLPGRGHCIKWSLRALEGAAVAGVGEDASTASGAVSGWFGADRTRLQETVVTDDRKTDDDHKVTEAQRNQPEAELVAEAECAAEDIGEDASEDAGEDAGKDAGEDDELTSALRVYVTAVFRGGGNMLSSAPVRWTADACRGRSSWRSNSSRIDSLRFESLRFDSTIR
jgi:hypothetical protein